MSKARFDRIYQTWEHTLDSERHAGAVYWYRMHNAMVDRCMQFLYAADPSNVRALCACYAVLSPNCSEAITFKALDRLLKWWRNNGKVEDLRLPAYGRNKDKAVQVLATRDVAKYVKGRKVLSFYANLVDPDNKDRLVTVDGHMANMWRGAPVRLAGMKDLKNDE